MTEVENNLNQHPAVSQSMVFMQTSAEGFKRLGACLVLKCGVCASIKELKQFLEKHLPSYMVPSHFITLESLPLTPNGKLDRRFLNDLIKLLLQLNEVAYKTSIEQMLIEIMTRTLHVENIEPHKTFIELGISSLSLMNIIVELEQTFSTKISISCVIHRDPFNFLMAKST